MTKEPASGKHVCKRDLMREQLAHQAAKLMAEDGITDHAYAKRKAARQLGAGDTRHLPSNEEIDAALRSFRQLFQQKTHQETLRRLREDALATMRLLVEFHPYLTGSVLSGTAGEQSDINLMLFSDNEKSVLLFLIKHNFAFEDGEWKVHFGGRDETVPSYTLTGGSGIKTHLILLPENARFNGSRKPETHADAAAVEALLGLNSQST
ncbi:MAG: nucleotidyltransferase domain-containing protein [Nitrosomonadales bacterium]|nr:nucleotidyltransferase domain-containing protein [Nitrosomonadales bacterium]